MYYVTGKPLYNTSCVMADLRSMSQRKGYFYLAIFYHINLNTNKIDSNVFENIVNDLKTDPPIKMVALYAYILANSVGINLSKPQKIDGLYHLEIDYSVVSMIDFFANYIDDCTPIGHGDCREVQKVLSAIGYTPR